MYRRAERFVLTCLMRHGRYGFMPHRVAFWIYWQALRLLVMGVPFFGHPAPGFQSRVELESGTPRTSLGQRFHWQQPKQYPWNAC